MDTSPYPINGIEGISKRHSYPPPTSFSPHHGCSNPHAGRAGTPDTPNSAHSLPISYPPSTQTGQRGGMYSMAQNPYPPHTGDGTLQTMAPAPADGRGPPVLRSMPPDGLMGQNDVGSRYSPGSIMHHHYSSTKGKSKQPIRVVGYQGRRGILPCSPGYPAAPAPGTFAVENFKPVKGDDDKFHCPYCTKAYLHGKHLKRHILRHTGDRFYKCDICDATFARSDVRKRHFTECSIRRGKLTKASSLDLVHALLKRNAEAPEAEDMPEST